MAGDVARQGACQPGGKRVITTLVRAPGKRNRSRRREGEQGNRLRLLQKSVDQGDCLLVRLRMKDRTQPFSQAPQAPQVGLGDIRGELARN